MAAGAPSGDAARDPAPSAAAEPGAPPRALLALGPEELERAVMERGGRPFHGRVARRALLAGAESYAEMTSLPKALRERLEAEVPLLAGREVARTVSADGTTKLLIELPDARGRGGRVETVHMPPREARRTGATLCVSTQVGCPVACPFCASGLAGLERNLAAHEIVEQFVRGLRLGPLERAVVMGIGEPMLNHDALVAALDVVHDELGLGARKVTVSTVGFPERLRRAARAGPRYQLAISLHSPDQELRDRLVPAMAGVPVEDVLAAGDDWFDVTGREVTYEYVVLAGTNDSEGHARRLADRLRGRRCTVNLIPFNPVDESGFARPSPKAVEAFRSALEAAGVVATVRWSRGIESDAACGQLRVRKA